MKRKLLALTATFLLSLTGYIFTSCGHEHEYVKETTLPTCTEQGYTIYTCKCGDTYKADIVNALEHSFTNYVFNNDAKCGINGTEIAVCDRENCSVSDTREKGNSALEHDYSDFTYNSDVIHGLHGTKSRTCKRENCNHVETVENKIEWTTYTGFSSSPIQTSSMESLNLNGFKAEKPINKFQIVYSSSEPIRGTIKIGDHSEDFYLEAGENKTYSSFTDFVLGDKSTYRNGEKVIDGLTYSGNISITIEPIKDGSISFKPISFSIANQYVPDKVIYISNDRFKVGSHLYYGGSLTYFEDLTDGRDDIGNVVNIHDGGRLVQQSVYGSDAQANGGESYNPVQGGNGYGFSKIIDFDIVGNTIHTISRAKNWKDTTNYRLTPSIFENWYTIEEDKVIVKNTFVDFLNASSPEYTVEAPALYWVGAFRNLSLYTGGNPWTGGELRTAKLINEGAAIGYNYKGATETWTACLNDEGWGIGCYTPNITNIVSGFYGLGGTDGITYDPLANPTVYVGMDCGFSLQPFEKLTYTYMLTTGGLQEIRDTFTENKDFIINDFPATFIDSYGIDNLDFTKPETLKLTHRSNETAVIYDEEREVTRLNVTGSDPYFGMAFFNAKEKLKAEDYPYVLVEYMIPESQAGKIKSNSFAIYMGLGNADWVSGSKHAGFSVIADGKWHKQYIDFGQYSWYTGNINVIRIDFIAATENGYKCYLKTIKFCAEQPEEETYEDSYTQKAKNYLARGRESEQNYLFNIEFPNKNYSSISPHGWLLCKDGIRYFEALIFEQGTKPNDYAKSAEAEEYWFYVKRTRMRVRHDAGRAHPNIGDKGDSAGFEVYIPLDSYCDGKTYDIYIRAITNGGDACLMYYGEHVFKEGQNYLSSGNAQGKYAVGIDSASIREDGYYYQIGWLLCGDGINRFEYLIVDSSADKLYAKSIDSEEYWQKATRTSVRRRADAAASCPNIGDDGSTAGFEIKIDVSNLEIGKTYKIYFRVITNGGDACLYGSITYSPQ